MDSNNMSKQIVDKLLDGNHISIVDIGAAGGLHTRWAKFTSRLRPILVEPDSRAYSELRNSLPEGSLLLNIALSDSLGEKELFLCKKQLCSSFYRPNLELLGFFPNKERYSIDGICKVATDTLDNQLALNGVEGIDFIKIDTQGHELPILNGSVKSLQKCIGLEVEVEFAAIYENQPLFSAVYEFCLQQGYSLFDIKRTFWKRNIANSIGIHGKGQLVFGDALFFKTPEKIYSEDRSENGLIRAICLYLSYGYFDLAIELYAMASHDIFESNQKIIERLFLCHRKRKIKFRGQTQIHALLQRLLHFTSPKEWCESV